jgi:hypothetical protein
MLLQYCRGAILWGSSTAHTAGAHTVNCGPTERVEGSWTALEELCCYSTVGEQYSRGAVQHTQEERTQ